MKNTLKNTSKVFGIIALAVLIIFSLAGCGSKKSGASVLTGISISTVPEKLNYHIGDELDTTGLKVQANYSDGSSELVNNNELSFDYDFFRTGKEPVIVTWHGKTTNFDATVDEWALIGLNIINPPSRDVYKNESTLDLTGLEIEAIYENRVESVPDLGQVIGSHMLTISSLNPAIAGNQTVTVSYGKGDLKVSDTFAIKMYALTGISAVPGKTIYKTGDNFDLEALTVTADYSAGMGDDLHEEVTNKNELAISGFTSVKADIITVTVTWKGKKSSFDVSVYILAGIHITRKPDKIKYSMGEELDPTGLEVTAYYSDGQHDDDINDPNPVPIEDLEITGFNPNKGGEQDVRVQYGTKSSTFSVTVFYPVRIDIINQTETSYKVGKKIDESTFKVQAVYSDGTLDIITKGNYRVGDYDHTTRGLKKITISYESLTTNLNVTYNPFEVTLYSNGGKWSDNSDKKIVEVDYNKTIDIDQGDPAKEYYSLVGWSKNPDGTSPWNIAGNVTDDLTLYAKWNLRPFNDNDEDSDLAEYLKIVGGTADNPFRLILTRDLGNIGGLEGNGWYDLLGIINTSGKFVNLDLSACTMSDDDFNPYFGAVIPGKAKIVELVLPDAAKTISNKELGSYTFRDFTNLKSVSLGSGFTSIGKYTFYNCGTLETLICKAKEVPSLGDSALSGVNAGLQIKVPSTSVNAYKAAEGWISFASKISGF